MEAHQGLRQQPGRNPQGVKERFLAYLADRIQLLQNFSKGLKKQYPADAFEQMESAIRVIAVEPFTKVLSSNANEFKPWVTRSERCQELLQTVIALAEQAATAFFQAALAPESYQRPKCQRHLLDLVIAIENLQLAIGQRTDPDIEG